MTSSSMEPKNSRSIGFFTARVKPITARLSTRMVTSSCCAASLAFAGRFAPNCCETTTAPPLAIAAKTANTRLLIISTRETPDTAASPTAEIMTVSIIPTVIASVCSKIRGTINALNSFGENRRFSGSVPLLSVLCAFLCSKVNKGLMFNSRADTGQISAQSLQQQAASASFYHHGSTCSPRCKRLH
jgi:hypothetical protein